ncbi:MAG: hypothetical protein ACXVZV_13555 [Terriglobales bacterium]
MVEVIIMIKVAARLALAGKLLDVVLVADGSRTPSSRGPYYPFSRPARLVIFLAGSLVFAHAITLMLPRAIA